MTQIDFYSHAENKLATACQLVGKAFERNLKVQVLTPDLATAQLLDKLLWTTPAIGFIPHCLAGNTLARETPIVIDHEASSAFHDEVLLNLRPEEPAFFSRFQRLIEIVGRDDEHLQVARERFRAYRDRGYPIQNHNLSSAAAEATKAR
jgi:DNA polymerase III subunit chi